MAREGESNKSLMTLIIGAALGAAGVYLSDRKNRDKVREKWGQLKEEGKHKVDELKQKGSDRLEDLQGKLEQGKEKAQEEIDEAQEQLRE